MNSNDLFRAEIAAARRAYITDCCDAVLDAGHPADVVANVAFLAGCRWDDLHPTLAGRLEAVAS